MAQTYTENLNIPKMNPETPLLHTQIDNALEQIDVAALPVSHADSKMHWPMWKKATAYQKKDVFRTETIPSWGFWEVTTAGTSGNTAPVGYVEGDTATDGTCELILRRLTQGGGGSTVDEERLWKGFEKNHVYAVGDVFRTPTTPSWGYWQVTTAGTSDTTVPSGTSEADVATSGTMDCVLMRLGNGGGGSEEYVAKAKAWAMSDTSPDGEVDVNSPTGHTQSSKSWSYTAETKAAAAKTSADKSEAWAVSTGSPDGQTDIDSPTGETQSSRTWALHSEYYGKAAEEYAAQTETQVDPYEWNASTTYNYPDVVAYVDGYTYRCVGQNVVGDVPGISMNWVCLSRVTSAAWEYDTNGGLMPVINPVGDSDWELDANGGLMPTAAV